MSKYIVSAWAPPGEPSRPATAGRLVAEIEIETLDTPNGLALDALMAVKTPLRFVMARAASKNDGAAKPESIDAEDTRPPAAANARWDRLKEVAEATGLDLKKMEAAADRFVLLGTELGLTRKEMASVCSAIAANHMIATGVERERAAMAMDAMYAYRLSLGLSEKVLVKE